jgi:OOP family OmpA-OmpF porin
MTHRPLVLLAFAALGAVACAPRVFHDGTTIAVTGTVRPEPVAAAVPERIELRDKVQFAKNSARILETSHAVLDEAAAEIASHPTIRRIRIEGHASADGNDQHNLELSARRAESVRSYLVGKGIAADILVAEGFGETRPVADNESPEGREANRRVELHVLETAESGSSAHSAP